MADQTIDLSELRALGDQLETLAGALHNQRLLNRLGLAGTRLVRTHTRAGLDKTGASMGSYSAAYARLKERANIPTGVVSLEYGVVRLKAEKERGGGLPIEAAPVRANLYDSMMSHLSHVVSADLDSVSIEFDRADKAEIMGYHIDAGRDPMGFSDDETEQLVGLVGTHLAELVATFGS